MEDDIERVTNGCVFRDAEDVAEDAMHETAGMQVEERVPPNGSTGGPLLVAVASNDQWPSESQGSDAAQHNVRGWEDGYAHLVRIWAIYDEQFQDYLDDIRMVGEFAGDVSREPPKRPHGPRPGK
jgi:hypothetical protein